MRAPAVSVPHPELQQQVRDGQPEQSLHEKEDKPEQTHTREERCTTTSAVYSVGCARLLSADGVGEPFGAPPFTVARR